MKQNFSDQIGSDMGRIIDSEEHKNLFTAPVSLKKEAQLDLSGTGQGSGEKAFDPNTSVRGPMGQSPIDKPNPAAQQHYQPLADAKHDPTKSVPSSNFVTGPQMGSRTHTGPAMTSKIQQLRMQFVNSPESAGAAGGIAASLKPGSNVTKQEMDTLAAAGVTKEEVETMIGHPVSTASVRDMVDALVKIADDLASLGYSTSEMVADRLIESIAMETNKALRKQAELISEALDGETGKSMGVGYAEGKKDKKPEDKKPEDKKDKEKGKDDKDPDVKFPIETIKGQPPKPGQPGQPAPKPGQPPVKK